MMITSMPWGATQRTKKETKNSELAFCFLIDTLTLAATSVKIDNGHLYGNNVSSKGTDRPNPHGGTNSCPNALEKAMWYSILKSRPATSRKAIGLSQGRASFVNRLLADTIEPQMEYPSADTLTCL
jgi:hypothetical protein